MIKRDVDHTCNFHEKTVFVKGVTWMLMVQGHYYLGRGFEELDWNAWQTVIKSNGSYAEYGEMGD